MTFRKAPWSTRIGWYRAGIRAVGGTAIEGTGVEIDDAVLDGSDVWELTAIDFQPPSARKEN